MKVTSSLAICWSYSAILKKYVETQVAQAGFMCYPIWLTRQCMAIFWKKLNSINHTNNCPYLCLVFSFESLWSFRSFAAILSEYRDWVSLVLKNWEGSTLQPARALDKGQYFASSSAKITIHAEIPSQNLSPIFDTTTQSISLSKINAYSFKPFFSKPLAIQDH